MSHRISVVAVAAAALWPLAAAAQLGPAPYLEHAETLRGAITKAAVGGNPIDNQHRGEAVGHFYSRWWPYLGIPAGWTGSVAGCVPGTISQARRDATIATVNYYRALVALPDTVALDPTLSTGDQQMALMIGANDALSHFPPPTWTCYTSGGADAASHSNIALGLSGVDAIDAYMDDYGSGNYEVGHRRWILYPPQALMGTGDVEGGDTLAAGNALDVIDGFGTRPSSPEWVAWPPAGFVPYWLLPAGSNRWSFSYPGANFSAATVTMTRGATSVPVLYEALATGYGDNTLVWLPQGVSYAAPASDTTYSITVSNVIVASVARSFSYSVTVFKPVKPARLADRDNDGQSDVLWANASALQAAAWYMKGGALDHSAFFPIPGGWSLRGTGDVDGDGYADLVWTNPATQQLAVWFMNGNALIASSFFGMGGGWDLSAIGDFNGDGKADFLFRNTSGAAVAWLMAKAGIIGTVTYPSVGSDWTVAGTGDFVGARKDQILWRHAPSGDYYLWTNADTPSVSLAGLGNPGAGWQLKAIGDFDGDGRADLFWRNGVGENAIWLQGASASATFPPGVGIDWTVIGSAQTYGDGRSNVFWQHAFDGVVAQWRFGPTLAPSTTFLTSVPSGWVPLSL